MALSPSEAGLTQDQYEALQDLRDKYSFQVIAERQNLDFSRFATSGISATSHTDAIVLDAYLFYVADTVVDRITLSDGTGGTFSPSTPSGLTANSTYSLASNGSTLYLFAATATGVQMNSTTDYGSNWSGWSTIVPVADQTIYSGNVARDGVASASSFYTSSTSTYPASNAFDETLGLEENFWATPIGTQTGTLQYDLGAGVTKIVTRYTVSSSGTAAPKDWTFQGSNNGSSWTTLNTVASSTAWVNETRTFSFSNSTAYRYYRLNITANNTQTQLQVFEVTFHETISDEAILLVAAATYRRIHFIVVDGINKVYYPYVTEYNGVSWANSTSNFPLTDRPYNLSVAVQGTTDVLLLETNVAGRVFDTLDDTSIVSERHKSGGLIVFHYKNDATTWSTHYEVDVLDELSTFAFIRYSHIKNLNGTLHVTAWIGSGTTDHPLTGFYDYTSVDGIHWSTRQRLYFGTTQSTYGVILLQSGEYAYAVEYANVWRSLSTSYTGYTATTLSEDITTYISEWNVAQNDMGQATFMLDNADGYFDDHSFINSTNKLKFTLSFGGFVDGEELLYPIGLFEVDDFATGESVPEHMIQISARDYMARMVERVKASESKVYTSYLLGMDNFQPKDGQNKGGLAHLYTVSGQIENGDSISALMRNNEGIGFSTFADDIWNGEISGGILITAGTSQSAAGLIFRAVNANHFWAYVYDYTTDKVQLWHKSFGTTIVYSSSALSWTGTIGSAYHYLRVRFLYGEIKLFTSTDNIIWTLQTTYTMDCSFKQDYDNTNYSSPISHFDPIERGSVGVYGLGLQSTAAAYVLYFRLNDFTLPLTVEDAFQKFASLAGIHDTEFKNLLTAGDSSWLSPTSVVVDTHLATGYYDEDVYDGAVYG